MLRTGRLGRIAGLAAPAADALLDEFGPGGIGLPVARKMGAAAARLVFRKKPVEADAHRNGNAFPHHYRLPTPQTGKRGEHAARTGRERGGDEFLVEFVAE